jgi:hypothetical protein
MRKVRAVVERPFVLERARASSGAPGRAGLEKREISLERPHQADDEGLEDLQFARRR